MKRLGWQNVPLGESNHAFKKRLGPFGSILKIPHTKAGIDLKKLDQVARETQALFIKLEPHTTNENKRLRNTLLKSGWKEERWSLQPTKTLLLDLKPSAEEILSSFEKDTRNCIRAAEKRGVVVEEKKDINLFWELYQQTSKRGHFWVRKEELATLWESFGKKARILVAYFEGQPLAAVLLILHDQTTYYYHAASSGKKRGLYPTYLLVWKSILLAKSNGCKYFDFVGITDPRIPSTKGWEGFSHFKRGFGGKEVTYLGSFIKIYNPFVRILFWPGRFF